MDQLLLASALAQAPPLLVSPARAFIMVAAVELTDLHVSHGNCGMVPSAIEGEEGYDHGTFDARQEGWHTHWLPYKLSDYRIKFLTTPKALHELDYTENISSIGETATELPVVNSGRADCMAVWVDYELSPGNVLQSMRNNTFPPHLKVNIKLFEHPKVYTYTASAPDSMGVVHCKSSFSVGDSDFDYDFECV